MPVVACPVCLPELAVSLSWSACEWLNWWPMKKGVVDIGPETKALGSSGTDYC
jgi:hypothetical protein